MSSGQSFRGGHGFAVVSAADRFSGSMGDEGGSVSNRRRFGKVSSGAGVSVAVVLAGSWTVGDSIMWLVVVVNLIRRSFGIGNVRWGCAAGPSDVPQFYSKDHIQKIGGNTWIPSLTELLCGTSWIMKQISHLNG
jgi:hypothetical protein